MRTDRLKATIYDLRQKDRQTRHPSSIKPWYRVRISTEGFIELMGLTVETPGEDQLNIWVPKVFFPPAVVPVKSKPSGPNRPVRVLQQNSQRADQKKPTMSTSTGDTSPVSKFPICSRNVG
jgi:hypothetical protein